MCVFGVSSVEHRILITKKYSGILFGVVYFFVAFCPAVNFSVWHFVRGHLVCGILSHGIMSGIPGRVVQSTFTLHNVLSNAAPDESLIGQLLC